jgi:hypothetical protein
MKNHTFLFIPFGMAAPVRCRGHGPPLRAGNMNT